MAKQKDLQFGAVSQDELGTISITTSVLEAIAAKAISEVPGVVKTESQLQKELGAFLGLTGDKIKATASQLEGQPIALDVAVHILYGYSAPQVALAIQETVKEQILFMTDIVIQEVNVHIMSVETDSNANNLLDKVGE
ncbi:Asp23/Gls24 family envelope stress response protein [Eremococcus coleocola]|uniref:Alkaline shock protein 23 n=1 Tax=Eremococcus coleocola ACS-139-V-Col8 TaxID=908337 RepID=E4KNJ4_9LACT|nr:Asp23/Gls24 family envelope stress response protein [Eremococcus coleocola]EFR31485.1 hypothetical protein HMPREF9257_0357 [Eremococcus coleocola ACS-139-V-Col8]